MLDRLVASCICDFSVVVRYLLRPQLFLEPSVSGHLVHQGRAKGFECSLTSLVLLF